MPVLAGSIVVNYFFGLYAVRRYVLVLGVAFNILLLAYFKYAWFVLGHVLSPGESSSFLDPVLPLAISFFTFQQIAYLVENHRGEAPRTRFLDYALFVSFFPQLIAGPIVRGRQTLPQIAALWRRSPRSQDIVIGATIFIIGLGKKTILADSIAPAASAVFDVAESGQSLGMFEAWAGALAYTFQIYFDFSGYCDMAIGSARMFGIRLPLNFYAPYKSGSIIEFWRRWHMTLSRFLRDYLYVPLGGNRRGSARRYTNILVVMLLGGLWHGAGWTFVVWGGLHGAYIVVNQAYRTRAAARILPWTKLPKPIAWMLTMICITVAWVAFRAETLGGALTMWLAMVGMGDGLAVMPARYLEALGPLAAVPLSIGVQFDEAVLRPIFDIPRTLFLLVALTVITLALPNTADLVRGWRPAVGLPPVRDRSLIAIEGLVPARMRPTLAIALFAASLIAMRGYSEFLYFQF